MNKKQIIDKIVNDLPMSDMLGKMTKEEWHGWFEECWDKAINYTPCCTELKCDCENTEDVKKIEICANCYNPQTGEW